MLLAVAVTGLAMVKGIVDDTGEPMEDDPDTRVASVDSQGIEYACEHYDVAKRIAKKLELLTIETMT